MEVAREVRRERDGKEGSRRGRNCVRGGKEWFLFSFMLQVITF